MKKVFIWLLLMLTIASPSYAQTFAATHIISASCPDESTGKSHTICYETTTEKFYQCVPDDNTCDKPNEWVIASVTFDTSQELADILTDETGSANIGAFPLSAVFSVDPFIDASYDSGGVILGKINRAAKNVGGLLISDDDCSHGDDGKWWWDDNEGRFEFCDEPNGLPTTFDDFMNVVSSTDNAITRFDGTAGEVQNSGVILDDNNNITGDGNMKIIGGVTTNGTLVLQANSATSGNTSTTRAIEMRVGDSGLTKAMTIRNDGRVALGTFTNAQITDVFNLEGTIKYKSFATSNNILMKVGTSAIWRWDSANQNIFLGGGGNATVSGNSNYGLFGSLESLTSGLLNLGIGPTLQSLTTGSYNLSVGVQSFPTLVDGNNNTGMGNGIQAFYASPSQQSDTFIGAQVNFQGRVGYSGGGYSTLIGAFSLPYGEGDYLTMIGAHDESGGYSLVTGSHDIGIGFSPLIDSGNDPSYTIAIGDEAGRYNGFSNSIYLGHGVDGISQDYELIIGLNSDYTISGLLNSKSVGIGMSPASITARLHLPAGTTSASSAPFKFTSGSLTTTAEAGANEYNDNFYDTKKNAVRYARTGGAMFDHFADATVGGAEADIYSDTLPANTFDVNGAKVLANYGGNFVTIGTELTQLKVKFAGTTIWDSTGVAPATGTTSWRIYVELIRVSSSVVRYSVSLNTSGASGYTYCTVGELTGLTLTGTNILKITGTSTGVGSGSGDIVGKMSNTRYASPAN